MPYRVTSDGSSTPAQCSSPHICPYFNVSNVLLVFTLHHHPEPRIFLQPISFLFVPSNHSSDAPSQLPLFCPLIRSSSHEQQNPVLANLPSRNLNRLQERLAPMAPHSWPKPFNCSRALTRDCCELVIARLLDGGVRLLVLVVMMGRIGSAVGWVPPVCPVADASWR